MYSITITAKYRIKDKVYRLTDPDKQLYIVTGYYVDFGNVMYEISGEEGVFTFYDYEIDLYENRLKLTPRLYRQKLIFIMEQEPTFGEKRVQRNFNPTANPIIEGLKSKYATLIDDLESLKIEGKDGRCISIAQTELETSCMYAVKSLFA